MKLEEEMEKEKREKHCKSCGACAQCERCDHCGKCKKCGKEIVAAPVFYPYYVPYPYYVQPYYPQYPIYVSPWLGYTRIAWDATAGTISCNVGNSLSNAGITNTVGMLTAGENAAT